jgi:multimeric flavodoxin WrbA
VVGDALTRHDVEVELVRVLDYDVRPGVSSDEGDGDQWPALREKILASEVLVIATPTWLGQISSVAKRVLERMDAMLSETDDEGRPVAYGRVAGFVVTGNEDGAHHCIAQLAQGLIDIGWTVPGQAWTYWNGPARPGPGPATWRPTRATSGRPRPDRPQPRTSLPWRAPFRRRCRSRCRWVSSRGGTRGTPPRLGDRGDAL